MHTRQTLLAVLAGLPLDQWGTGWAKSVDDLWRELIAGDCTLEHDPLRRVVRVVEVHIERDGKVLIEVAQAMADGTVRPRGRRPAEKLRPDEDPRQGAIRCLAEEMGVGPERITLGRSHPPRIEESRSPSYPGLTSRYTLIRVDAVVQGLPDGPFQTVECESNPDDPVRGHHWDWLDPPRPPS